MHCPKCRDVMEYVNGVWYCDTCEHQEYFNGDPLVVDEEENYETSSDIIHCKELNKDRCPKCGYDWEAHEFAVPEPYCPDNDEEAEAGREATKRFKSTIERMKNGERFEDIYPNIKVTKI